MKLRLLTPLALLLFFVSGCSYGTYRKEWIPAQAVGIPRLREVEFIEIVEKICESLDLELIERAAYDGEPWPALYTIRAKDWDLPRWMGIMFNLERQSVILWFDRGFNSDKNNQYIEIICNRIEQAIRNAYREQVEIEIRFDANFRMPADIF